MTRAARYKCECCSRSFTLEFFENDDPQSTGHCLFCETKQTVSSADRPNSDVVTALQEENKILKEEVKMLNDKLLALQLSVQT